MEAIDESADLAFKCLPANPYDAIVVRSWNEIQVFGLIRMRNNAFAISGGVRVSSVPTVINTGMCTEPIFERLSNRL